MPTHFMVSVKMWKSFTDYVLHLYLIVQCLGHYNLVSLDDEWVVFWRFKEWESDSCVEPLDGGNNNSNLVVFF